MRLTLRTLLAYLDDVLEPAEAQDLGARIGESEFATNLVHRIREAMRREKLGAPRLQGKAAGLDPNTVAEYLDNTLSGERVVDFEKYCLESEVHLAETACCHQVLALVLGEPALVDPDSRRRVYGLLAQYDAKLKGGATPGAASAALSGGGLGSGATATPPRPAIDDFPQPSTQSSSPPPQLGLSSFSPPMAMRKRAEVPDYLRNEALGLSAWWKLAAAVLVVVLLACAVTMAVGPLWWNKDRAEGGASQASPGDGKVAHGDPPVKQPGEAARSVDLGTPANVDPGKVDEGKADPGKVDPGKAAQEKKQLAIEVTPKVGVDTGAEPLPAPVEVDLPPKLTPKAVLETPKVAPVGDGANVGQLTLTERKSVLFRRDAASGRWSRLSVPATLSAGEVLLCPPVCRNTLMLRGDLQVQTIGDTQLELRPSPAGTPPGIHLHYGRLVMMTAGDGRTTVPVQAGDRKGTIAFTKPGTVLALDVRLVRSPGSDPEKVRSRSVADLFAVGTGSIVWDEGNGQPITVDAPGRRTIGLLEGEFQPEGPAAWVNPEPLSNTEQLGFNNLEPKLQNQAAEHLNESLPEWIVVQQREVQSLAYRWLISIDQFDDAVRALGQSKNRESYFWPKIIEHLRLAVARDPQTAAKVRQALEKVRGDKAAGLYRMLWGYSEQDLTQGGQAKTLVGHLEHEDLDYRVLSSWCLLDITSSSNSFYRPDAPAETRARDPFVLEWKRKLEAGKIVPPKKKQ